MKNKLNGSSHIPELQDIANDYEKLLSHCNAMDYVDLIASVKGCITSDENLNHIYQRQNYVICGSPTSMYEVRGELNQFICTIVYNKQTDGWTDRQTDRQTD